MPTTSVADVLRRFEKMRAKGEFTSTTGGTNQPQATPSVHEPPPRYEDGNK